MKQGNFLVKYDHILTNIRNDRIPLEIHNIKQKKFIAL